MVVHALFEDKGGLEDEGNVQTVGLADGGGVLATEADVIASCGDHYNYTVITP